MIKILCFIFTRITLFIEYDFLDLKCSIIQDRDVFRFLLLVITTKAVGIGVCFKDVFCFVDLSIADNLTNNYLL